MSTRSTPVQPTMAARTSLVTTHPLMSFFALAYAISWVMLLPLLLGRNGLGLLPYTVPSGPATLLIILQSFGPTVAGLLMAARTGPGARSLLRHYLRFRAGVALYVVILLGTPLMLLLGATIVRGTSAWQALFPAGVVDVVLLLPAYAVNLVVLFVIGGPLGEEGGWRGFALPRLQARHGALLASLILAPAWVLWHLPLFFIPQAGTFQGNVLVYLGMAVALSIMHTWIYNRTQGSLFLVTLLHAAVDASTRTLLPAIFGADRAAGNLAPLLGFGIAAVLVLAWTRGHLAYRPTTTDFRDHDVDLA